MWCKIAWNLIRVYSCILVASLLLFWRMSCYFIVLVLVVLCCVSSSWCLLIWLFPWYPILSSLIVCFWFPHGSPFSFGYFPLSPIFYLTLFLLYSVHRLAVPHAAGWCCALVWNIERDYCSGILSSRNSLRPLENSPVNLPSWSFLLKRFIPDRKPLLL